MKDIEQACDKLRHKLKALIDKFKNRYACELRRKENAYLIEYVNSEFIKIADPTKYKLSTKCWYVANWFKEFVKYCGCGQPIKRNIFSITHPVMDFCCVKCVNSSDESRRRMSDGCHRMTNAEKEIKVLLRKQTCLELYGDENYRNDSRREKTLQERYGEGITNPF